MVPFQNAVYGSETGPWPVTLNDITTRRHISQDNILQRHSRVLLSLMNDYFYRSDYLSAVS